MAWKAAHTTRPRSWKPSRGLCAHAHTCMHTHTRAFSLLYRDHATGVLFWKVHILEVRHRFCNQMCKNKTKQTNNQTTTKTPRSWAHLLSTGQAHTHRRERSGARQRLGLHVSGRCSVFRASLCGVGLRYHRLPWGVEGIPEAPPFCHPAPACCDRARLFPGWTIL